MKEKVSSGMLLTNKQEHMVIKHIPVMLTCGRKYHTYHGSYFSPCKKFSAESATSTSLKSTLLLLSITSWGFHHTYTLPPTFTNMNFNSSVQATFFYISGVHVPMLHPVMHSQQKYSQKMVTSVFCIPL